MRGLARILMAAMAVLGLARGAAAETVNFGTDWKAEAEHGGYYQAIAAGIYKKYGLEVNLRPGGPQVNHAQLLAAGALDFNIASNSFVPLNFVQQKIPMVAVAAIFQKDPSVLIAHPGQGDDSLAALKGKPIMIGSDTRVTSWAFLKQKFGYTDDQIRPYSFSVAPFLADPKAIQQGLSDERAVHHRERGREAGGVADSPMPDMAAMAGLIETSAKTGEGEAGTGAEIRRCQHRGLGQLSRRRPGAGENALIKRDNPEMTDALLAYGRDKMKEYGVVDSGDTKEKGIGAMTDARWRDFLDTMAKAGLYPADLDVKQAYSLQFLNKKVGMKP